MKACDLEVNFRNKASHILTKWSMNSMQRQSMGPWDLYYDQGLYFSGWLNEKGKSENITYMKVYFFKWKVTVCLLPVVCCYNDMDLTVI